MLLQELEKAALEIEIISQICAKNVALKTSQVEPLTMKIISQIFAKNVASKTIQVEPLTMKNISSLCLEYIEIILTNIP